MNATAARLRGHQTSLILLGFGAAISLAAWVGGQHGLAVALAVFYLVCTVASELWAARGRGDVAAILRTSGDERQRLLDLRATAIAGIVTIVFCLGGAVADLARGGTGNPWVLICGVAGATYAVALEVLRRRG